MYGTPLSIGLISLAGQGLSFRLPSLGSLSRVSKLARSVQQTVDASFEGFWAASGQMQSYLNFALRELDPRLDRLRMAAPVIAVSRQIEEVTTFTLKPPARWAGFESGQYVRVEVEIDGIRHGRLYSLSGSARQWQEDRTISFTVRRQSRGLVSGWLHDSCEAGDLIHISPAAGDFRLPDELTDNSPILLLAAGSGMTPVIGMFERLALERPDLNVRCVYAVRGQDDVLFAERLRRCSRLSPDFRLSIVCSDTDGRLDADGLLSLVPDIGTRKLYMCGPEGLMETARQVALDNGAPTDRIFSEQFLAAPATAINAGAAQAQDASVSFGRTGGSKAAEADASLLEIAESAGLRPKFGCRSGICKECMCEKASGTTLNRLTGEVNSDSGSAIQACISVPLDQVVIANW